MCPNGKGMEGDTTGWLYKMGERERELEEGKK